MKAIKPDRPPLFTQALLPPMLITLLMWIVYKADTLYNLDLYIYGIFPQKLFGLRGILFTPLIHDTESYFHILENSLALIFFGTMVFYFYPRIAWKVLAWCWLLGGLLVWSMAKPVFHVGMSGVIYGLAFFMITGSIIRKNRQLTGLNFLIIFLYGSIFWGLFPLMPQVSWESHLAGALTGIGLGYFYRGLAPQHVFVSPPIQDDPGDDAPDAWWKTGVIRDPDEPESQIHYHYRAKSPGESGKDPGKD